MSFTISKIKYINHIIEVNSCYEPSNPPAQVKLIKLL